MKIKSIILAAIVLSIASPAAFAETINLKIATFVTPKHGMSQWIKNWAEGLEEKSAGRLKFEVLDGAQMGPPPKYYDIARNGQADITWVLHGATPGRFPLTEISNMPFLFCSAEQATRVINNPQLRSKYLDPEHKGVKVLVNFMHPPGQINMSGDAVLKVDDLKGKAIRPPSRSVGQFIGMLGGKPVGLPPTAMAESLQKGTINGTFIDYGGAGLAFQLGPFLKNITEVYAYTSSFTLVMNPDSYAELPDDLRVMIDESMQGVEGPIGGVWDKLDAIGKGVLTKAGVKINKLPPDELTKLKGVGAALTTAYTKELSDKGLPSNEVLTLMAKLADEVGPVGLGCQE